MRILFLVNKATRVSAGQSTALLLLRAAARGHEVFVCGVEDLEVLPSGAPGAMARRVPLPGTRDRVGWMAALRGVAVAPLDFAGLDLIFIRTNPGRDAARASLHETALGICRIARDQGVVVLSDPDGLTRAATKLYVSRLPAHIRPATLVSRDAARIEAFVRSQPGRTILKPLSGTQGTDVFRVEPDGDANLRQIIDVLVRQGYAMAQEWVPDATRGDVRLIVLQGELLEIEGEVAAVRRVPAEGEIRSNVHRGGSPERAEREQAWADVVEAIRPHLLADGLFLAGLDLIGDLVVEVNVFSPGGLDDAEAFSGVAFASAILDAVESEVRRKRGGDKA